MVVHYVLSGFERARLPGVPLSVVIGCDRRSGGEVCEPRPCESIPASSCGCRNRDPFPFPKARVPIDPITHMQDELRRRSGHSFAMRHVIERPLQLRMLVDILANLSHALA